MFKTPKFTQMPEPPTFKYENVQTEVEKPMNPNAKEAFKKAVEEAKNYVNSDVKDEVFDAMMSDFRKRYKGCPYYEPKHEEEHINKAVLTYYPHAWEDFLNILLLNGYKVSIVKVEAPDSKDDKLEITWKDKHDLVDEIKKMARELEVER